eukprot:8493079-Ditylum_brightwellii.AAC.1
MPLKQPANLQCNNDKNKTMSNFQKKYFDEQQAAVTMQGYHQRILNKYLYDDEFIPFEELISKHCKDAAIKLQSAARLFLQRSSLRTVQNNLLMMLEKIQKDLNQDMEEMKQRWPIRNAIQYDKYLSKPNAT